MKNEAHGIFHFQFHNCHLSLGRGGERYGDCSSMKNGKRKMENETSPSIFHFPFGSCHLSLEEEVVVGEEEMNTVKVAVR